MNGKEVIGKLCVGMANNEFTSSFDNCKLEEINTAYSQGKNVEFLNSKGRLILLTDTDSVLIEDSNGIGMNKHEFSVDDKEKNKICVQEGLLKDVSTSEQMNSVGASLSVMATSLSANISIPIKANALVNGNHICWAAVCASIVDYKKGTSHTAKQMYDDVWNSYGGTPASAPNGTWSNMQKAYNLHSYYPSEYSPLNGSAVGTKIQANIPIHMGMSDGSIGHSVALRGYTTVGGDTFYSLMDPNKPSYVSIYVSPTALSDGSKLVYQTTYGYTFTWYAARY